jgi:DNA polymerase
MVAAPVEHQAPVLLPDSWEELEAGIAACTRCGLHQGRHKAVPGVGDHNAPWFFVGEGPGAEEDQQGEPFVGQAGKLLDNMLGALDLARGQGVYIANVVKCRPPHNRNPEQGEREACLPWLQRQIEWVRPRVLVLLGKVAAESLLGSTGSLSALRGRVHEWQGIPVVVTWHPAYLLRSPLHKQEAWQDLCLARKTLQQRS